MRKTSLSSSKVDVAIWTSWVRQGRTMIKWTAKTKLKLVPHEERQDRIPLDSETKLNQNFGRFKLKACLLFSQVIDYVDRSDQPGRYVPPSPRAKRALMLITLFLAK